MHSLCNLNLLTNRPKELPKKPTELDVRLERPLLRKKTKESPHDRRITERTPRATLGLYLYGLAFPDAGLEKKSSRKDRKRQMTELKERHPQTLITEHKEKDRRRL